MIHIWSKKLKNINTVFQAEILALKEAVEHALEKYEDQHTAIYVDNRASIQVTADPKSTSQTARITSLDISYIILSSGA
ncbi:hypothetical protein AVEN_101123-1 [Araneus ventricosus]|uniref:RNase H type-1 domain-containing protein n=1 Tax=Araneus ventricosus TaxID=182803 RepID=A0A4Y2LGI5_ARAVE|nr:hypothetical protein AVEN_101123-1 [Araneus ventricosus]